MPDLKIQKPGRSSAVVVWLAPLILFGKILLSGSALFWGLPALQFIPWRLFAWQEQTLGLLPLWNSLNGMGAPLLANYQLAWFYPPAWITIPFQLLGGAPALAWALTLLVPLHLAWAGWGMFRLARSLGLNDLAQWIAGLAFGLSGYFVARSGFFTMIWAGAWLPWILLGASALAAPGDRRDRAAGWIKTGLVVPVTMQLLAGHAQLTWYTLVLAAAWVCVGGFSSGSWKNALKALLAFAANGLIAAAVAAIQLAPTAEFLLQSQRSAAVDFELGLTYSFWPWRLLTLLSPNFFGNPGTGNYFGYASYWEDAVYIGFIPLVLALSTLRRLFSRARDEVETARTTLAWFAWAITAIGLLFALGKNTPIFPFLYEHIPTFSQFNGPARWMIWPVFGLALLAGLAANDWRRPVGKSLRRFKRLTAAAMALALGAGIAWIVFREIQVTFIEATATMGIWAVSFCGLTLMIPPETDHKAQLRWKVAVVLCVCLDLCLAGWALIPTVPASFFSDNHPKPAALVGDARTYIMGKDEYALKFRRFFRFADYRPIEDWNALYLTVLPNMNLMPGSQFRSANNFDPLQPGRYARWVTWIDSLQGEALFTALGWMNVGALIERDSNSTDGIRKMAVTALDRVRWVPCRQAADGEAEAWNAVTRLVSRNDQTTVVLEGSANGENQNCAGGQGSAQLVTEANQRMVIRTEANQAGTLLIADTWYPGWRVSVDGNLAELLRANYLFIGVSLAAGKHQVILEYQPVSLALGAGISTLGLLFMLLWSMLRRHRVQ